MGIFRDTSFLSVWQYRWFSHHFWARLLLFLVKMARLLGLHLCFTALRAVSNAYAGYMFHLKIYLRPYWGALT